MKVIISPDSFKGTLTSVQVSKILETSIKEINPHVETICLPIADGGEGTLGALISATNGQYLSTKVQDPIGRLIDASFGILGDGQTCVIEMAKASGLTLLNKDERDPFIASTYGTGQLIKQALNLGYRKFIIGIGGSATNDAGIGMLKALGMSFKNERDEELQPYVKSIAQLAKIDDSNFNPLVAESHFIIACDVDNPLIGPNGATAVFGPQKGITSEQIPIFDSYCRHFADKVELKTGIRIHDYPGAGAAGGIGGAFIAFFPCLFRPGIDVVTEAVHFEKYLHDVQYVITGEGKSDLQTLSGKAPIGIALLAQKYNVPTILISGYVDEEAKKELHSYFQQIISIVGEDISMDQSQNDASYYLKLRALQSLEKIMK